MVKFFASFFAAASAMCCQLPPQETGADALSTCETYAPYSGQGDPCAADADCRAVQPEDGESPCMFAQCTQLGKPGEFGCVARNPAPLGVCGEGRSCDQAGSCCIDMKP